MAKNSRMLNSQQTQRINLRFFFIKNRTDNRELIVIYYPTSEMIDDFFTEPFQGAKFIDFRDIIMGVYANQYKYRECVVTLIM